MDLDQFTQGFHLLWEHKPGAIILLGLGFFVFVFVVVDAWRHKRRRKQRH
jgi:hypothetical protein